MAGIGFDRAESGRNRLGVAILAAASILGLMAARRGEADENEKGQPAASGTADRADRAQRQREAREIARALKNLHDAVMKEGQAERGKGPSKSQDRQDPLASLPARPARTIKAPTLDPAGLDALIDRWLTAAKAPSARLTTDEEFVRRAYLDLTGKLPSPEQVLAFERDRDRHRRAHLIDRLLDSPDYATNWAHYWRDVIRFHAANENPGQVRYPKFEEWMAAQLAANRPWDEIVTDLITATGRNDENGATIFGLAQMAQPVELAGEVSRVFLGVQIQCAQCHDHPNDPWKREQFHQFAAFFAGSRARRAADPGATKAEAKKAKAEVKKGKLDQAKAGEGQDAAAEAKAKARAMMQGPPAFELILQPGRPRYTMPDLKDPQKAIPVSPRFFLAGDSDNVPDGLTAEQRRVLVASYVTGQDNPWFARAFVNRAWFALMGEGFYNPVDDLGPARTPHAPEVLDALATAWQQGGYDVKWLFRTIMNTKAYQRESRASNTAAGRTPFASNCPSRLRSDQILDALAHALNLPLDGPGGKKGEAGPRPPRYGPRAMLNVLFGLDPSTPVEDVLGTIPQALFLMNNPQVNRAIKAGNGTVLGEILASTPDDRRVLEALYLRVLARRPNAKEVSLCARYLDTVGDRREAFEDILWSLINSTEFVSRR